jgi:DNA invertase Pin-like site-specific DNA recombinase
MQHQQRPTGGRGLISLRVSDPRQDLEEQRNIIQAWLDTWGLAGNVVEWYMDVGSRLEAYRREGFQALLKRVTRGDIDWIAVECLDRFGVRSAAELGKFVCHLQDCGVKLYAISEGLEITSDDAFTALTTTIGTLRSTDELRARAHRSLKGRLARFRAGEHGGGLPPYGFDVACIDRFGVEVWRLAYIRLDQRVQIFPDGRRVPFDGPRNTPKKNLGETLRYVPSVFTERAEWLRQIFQWWVGEDIPHKGIATRLNNLKVDAVNGKGWSGSRIKKILENPCYAVGCQVGNKSAKGKVLGWSGGEEVKAKLVGGKTGRYTRRAQSDYVYPSGDYEPLIAPELWASAQAKNAALPARPRAPRNPELWLAGLVVCAGCGSKMTGLTHRQGRWKICLCCSHHRHYGAASACKLNRVPHSLVERLLERYLEEAGVKLDTILGTADPAGALRSLHLEVWSRQRDYLGTLAEMVRALHEAGIETEAEIDGAAYETCDVKAEYRRLREARQAALAADIQAKEDELRGFVRNIPKLTSDVAIKMAEEEMLRLGGEIEALKQAARPLDERAAELREAIRLAIQQYQRARDALAGAAPRQKSEAVRGLVRSIRLHFEAIPNGKHGQATSRLVRAEIIPVEGDRALVLVPDETPA